MMESLQFGSALIRYKVEYSNRKTLGITVTPDMSVVVKAPEGARLEKIKVKVRSKAPWILRQQQHFLSFQPKMPKRRFINGESHLYLGRNYRLLIKKGNNESVKIKSGFMEVTCVDVEQVNKLIKQWYIKNARVKFQNILNRLIVRFQKYKVAPSAIVVREMPTRWGSCTPQGKIILNPELIKAPTPCIEYVIVHELCHLVYHAHSRKFMELQNREMPDWEKWKNKLEQLLA